MRLFHTFAEGSAVFDEDNLVSVAGLVPVMTLAEQTGLTSMLAEKVCIASPRIKSGSANLAPKLATLIAGMAAGADSIDDIDLLRSGGCKELFDSVYAPSMVGTGLREFAFGHAKQLESVLREHLLALSARTDLLPGAETRVFVDIDSLLRPVYGHQKQGASYGHTKISGKQVLRKGLSPLAATLSTDLGAPVVAGMRLRAGKTGSGKGAGSMVTAAIGTARATGATGTIVVSGDSAYGNRKVVRAALRAGAQFSLVLTKNAAVKAAIASIPDDAWTPVKYPGAVRDPDTGDWISDAEVAEIGYTAFASTKDVTTARLIVRRVKDARYPDALFPVWRYHPFFTNSTEPVVDADITHRKHAVIETVFADLIDGPLAHMPSGRFGANYAWVLCAAITHNLLRDRRPRRRRACSRPRRHPASQDHQHPRPSGPPATPPDPAPAPPLALGRCLAHLVAQHNRLHATITRHPLTTGPHGPRPRPKWKSWPDQRLPHARTSQKPHRWIEAKLLAA